MKQKIYKIAIYSLLFVVILASVIILPDLTMYQERYKLRSQKLPDNYKNYHYQPTKFKNSKKKLCIPLFKGYFFVFGKPTSPFFNQKDQVEGKAIYFCAFV